MTMSPMMQTNAADPKTASTLAELTQLDQGTLLSVRVHKMGEARGSAGSRVVYGDDEVHVLIWTGFQYQALIARSHKMLNQQLAKGGYIERLARATLDEHADTTIEDVCAALQEIRGWFRRKLSDGEREPWGALDDAGGVWKGLEVDGVQVRGSRVYIGGHRREDPRAPVPGTIYVQGVKLGEVVLKQAVNGSWITNSSPKTLAKALIKEALPVGLYCQYRLEPDRTSALAVGADAAKAAKAAKIGIDPDALRALFKIAP